MAFTKNKWWSPGNQDWSQFVSEGPFLSDPVVSVPSNKKTCKRQKEQTNLVPTSRCIATLFFLSQNLNM